MNDFGAELARLVEKAQFAQLPFHVVVTSDVFNLPGVPVDDDMQSVCQECETINDVIAVLRPYVGKPVKARIFQGRRIPTINYPFALVVDGQRIPVIPEGVASDEIDPSGSMAVPVAQQKLTGEIVELSPDDPVIAGSFNTGDLQVVASVDDGDDDEDDDSDEEGDDFDGLDEEADQE